MSNNEGQLRENQLMDHVGTVFNIRFGGADFGPHGCGLFDFEGGCDDIKAAKLSELLGFKVEGNEFFHALVESMNQKAQSGRF